MNWEVTPESEFQLSTGTRASHVNSKNNLAGANRSEGERLRGNRLASECFLPFLPTRPLSFPSALMTWAVRHISSIVNKLTTKGNITISCRKGHFSNSIEQHLLNHKIGNVIYAEKNQSLIVSTSLTTYLGSILYFKFLSNIKGNRGVQLQHIQSTRTNLLGYSWSLNIFQLTGRESKSSKPQHKHL